MANNLLDTLYCSEEHDELEEQVEIENSDDEYQSSSGTATSTIINSCCVPSMVEGDMVWEEQELTWLLDKEQHNGALLNLLQSNAALESGRREAVEWILKVNAHYSFSALTAVLAVNYFDRFLFSFRLQNTKPWISHLAAVASLSLAAKVEETRVPLLLDLQVEQCRYLFEAKTIKRMEILVLSILHWKMNPPTPISFLDHFARRLGFKDLLLSSDLLSKCEAILLSLLPDSRFTAFLPSVLATATMLHALSSVDPLLGLQHQSHLFAIRGIDKEKVNECWKVMLEGWEQGKQCMKRKLAWVPGSPNDVMEMSFSCDSSNDSWAVSSSPESEPLSKKTKTQDFLGS